MVMGSDMAPERGRAQWMSVWRFIGQSGSQLSPTVFAVIGGFFSYAGAFVVVGVSSLSVALLVGLFMKETLGRDRGPEAAQLEAARHAPTPGGS